MIGTTAELPALAVVFLAAIVYHELGHLAATEYLGTTESLIFFHRKGRLKWFVWGVAIRHDGGDLTQRQRLLAALAPLAWLLPATPLLRWTNSPLLNAVGVILFLAGAATLVSDIPFQLLGWGSTDEVEAYELINFRRTNA